ncbi:MAG: LytTR family DNA-binding domain-containing protein [Bacteroidetes bacterium]|nr:LytTR family DNA-binding domain-containing protein [Bacteroidota bacterium]MDA0943338.1 LytTR family DNA-binding domain-containing protein [Bacteroidota bacterium]MDA1111048.1 LytTR family DNA-binding domain-containing protein [Bacteroidota bacterium]
MKNLTCILIDDEPLAIEVLKAHLAHHPELSIMATFTDSSEALAYWKSNSVDVVFTDINMPSMDGLTLVNEQMGAQTAVVFTTAHADFAAEAFDLEALDYLLKPISPERIAKSVHRILEFSELRHQSQASLLEDGYLFVKVDGDHQKIQYKDIHYVEAFADYVKIWTSPEKRYVTLQTMRNMEQTLPSELFLRTHRSFIVSIDKISSIQPQNLQLGTVQIPIGKNYKESVAKLLQKSRL